MAAENRKTMLVVIRHSPYGSSLAKAALDVALAAAAFEQEVDLLFMGDGVLQLLKHQDSAALGRKNIGRQWASLPLYDINTVHVDAEAAARYNIKLDELTVESRALDANGINQLMTQFDHLLGF
jgi:tRNA 2-thiouridine synthesizing protein C